MASNGTGVGVVKIEVSDHYTVGESGEIGEVLWPLIKTVDGMAEVISDAAALAILAGGLSAPRARTPQYP